jgi:hypothetical protein
MLSHIRAEIQIASILELKVEFLMENTQVWTYIVEASFLAYK